MKQNDLAVSMLRYTLDTPPESDDTWAYNLLGGIMGTVYKDSLAAVENFQKSLALEPDMPVVYGNWALMLRNLKDTVGAIEKYQKGIEIEPNYLAGYIGLGNIYYSVSVYDRYRSLRGNIHNTTNTKSRRLF